MDSLRDRDPITELICHVRKALKDGDPMALSTMGFALMKHPCLRLTAGPGRAAERNTRVRRAQNQRSVENCVIDYRA